MDTGERDRADDSARDGGENERHVLGSLCFSQVIKRLSNHMYGREVRGWAESKMRRKRLRIKPSSLIGHYAHARTRTVESVCKFVRWADCAVDR